MVGRNTLIPLFILLLCIARASAQGPEGAPEDTTEIEEDWGEDWTLDSLSAEDFVFDDNLIYHISHGLFPTPFKAASFNIYTFLPIGFVIDRASGLRTRAFIPTTAPFDGENPFRGSSMGDDEQLILKPGSDKPIEEGYPHSWLIEFGVRYLYHLPVPAILRADASFRATDGLLYSEDTSRSYLGLDGFPRPFREIGVVLQEMRSITGAVGLQIPVYGIFLENGGSSFSSYYYLFGGLGAEYFTSVKTTQYTQIADAKDQIRYANGQDTVNLLLDQKREGINRIRTSFESGIGWWFSTRHATFGTELFLSSQLNSLVDDGMWKEYYFGLRISIGGQWGTN